MKITFIYHSGVCIELDKSVLIFDYYKGAIPKYAEDKSVYIFASHKHPDHFSADIFALSGNDNKVHYILSSDIKVNDTFLQKNGIDSSVKQQIVSIGRNQGKMVDAASVKTLCSTDEGVAFIVEIEGKAIYHAGDLNWWHWNGETKAYNRNMEVNYKREIDSIKGQKFDVSFLPLDPRLEDSYDKGIRYFMENITSEVIVPIHMWDKYGYIKKYKDTLPQSYQQKVIEISCAGEEFVLQ